MTMPVIQLASIGTQITEAFAGLDRIREIRQMATEDQEDAIAAPLPDVRGEVEFRRRDVRVQPRRAGAEARVVPRAGRIDDGAGRIERLGQEHADQPRDGVQPAAVGPRARRRPRPDDVKLRDYRAHLGVVLQDNFLFDGTIAENIAYAQAARHARRDQGGQPHRPLRRVHRGVREGLRHDRRRARRAAVRRPAPARRDRARDSRRPARS